MERRIDHLVVAVRDLGRAANLYDRLGFQVGARNRHPWGTENRLIQLHECFLELVAIGQGADIASHGARRFSFGAFIRDYLARREGLAMLALSTPDATADAQAFAAARIGDFDPFSFARQGQRPDGSSAEVAFTLAFARNTAAPEAGFFVCQHLFPGNFWDPAFQHHANGATLVSAVVMTAKEPRIHRTFLEQFAGASATTPTGQDVSLTLAGGRIDALTPDDAAELYGSVEVDPDRSAFAAFAVRVPDIARVTHHLDAGGVPYQHIGSRIVVPASAALGVAIGFEPA